LETEDSSGDFAMSKDKIRILLALDGSDQSFEAARYVSQFFLPKRLDLVIFHVTSKIPESFWDIEKSPTYNHQLAPVAAWSTQEETRIQKFMEKARRMFIDGGVPEDSVEINIQEKKVGIARDILHEAQTNYDLVVVGRWGVSKLKDLVWGGVANKLIGHMVHCPLCVVGGRPQTGKILVALDTSEEAMRTVDFIGAIMNGKYWEVTLFHVIREDDFTSPRYKTSFVLHKEWEGKVREKFLEAEKSILIVYEEAMKRLQKTGVNPDLIATKTVTGVASRAKAIVDEARKGDFGTIVVGRRGLSRVEEFFMGRVSNKVLQLAKEMAVWVVN
jgi:nucleotide-binding universal stress UspA family protein